MRLKVAFKGNLRKFMKAELRNAKKAVSKGVHQATEGLKHSLRQQVRSANLGRHLSNSWRSVHYPRGKSSLRAAGVVYTKARKILSSFDKGIHIRSKDGWWLAIPTPHAPKRGLGGKRISPSSFPEARYGKLRFVYRAGKPSLLVVDNLQASYHRKTVRGFRKASQRNLKTGQKLATVVMFWLVPQVKMPRLIDFDKKVRRWRDKVPGLILRGWE